MTGRELQAAAALAGRYLPRRARTLDDWARTLSSVCAMRHPFLLDDVAGTYQHAATICRHLHDAGLLRVSNRIGRVLIYWWP